MTAFFDEKNLKRQIGPLGEPFRFMNMKCFKNIFVRSVRIIFFVMEKSFQLNAAKEFFDVLLD